MTTVPIRECLLNLALVIEIVIEIVLILLQTLMNVRLVRLRDRGSLFSGQVLL